MWLILDLHLPGLGGLDVLERLRSQGGSVILLTDQGDIETAVRAMQLGAEHFVTKPVDLDHLAAATARVCDKVRLMRQNALLREALGRLLSIPWPGNVREEAPRRRAGDDPGTRGRPDRAWRHLPADLRKGVGGGGGVGGTAPPAPGARRGGAGAHREDAQVPRREPHASGHELGISARR